MIKGNDGRFYFSDEAMNYSAYTEVEPIASAEVI